MLELKHILIAIDGSPTSAKAARAGIEFARRVGVTSRVPASADRPVIVYR